jgi:hypothetical protein
LASPRADRREVHRGQDLIGGQIDRHQILEESTAFTSPRPFGPTS